MITKILFTALVAVAVFAFARYRARAVGTAGASAPSPSPSRAPRLIAYGVAALIALSAALVTLYNWRDWHEVVPIRVVNTRTGETVTYKAHKGTIADRSLDRRRLEGHGLRSRSGRDPAAGRLNRWRSRCRAPAGGGRSSTCPREKP